jgi:phospholipase D1/2
MLVAIHTWDHTAVGAPDPQNDAGNTVLDAIASATGLGKKRPANVLWRMSSRTTTGMSHHQKFVVLDAPGDGGKRVLKAFFGGLDLTKGRFDFFDSDILPPPLQNKTDQPFRANLTVGKFSSDDWYNLEFGDNRDLPRQGWQDIYASVVGPAAWDVTREFVGRWNVVPFSLVTPPSGDVSDAQRQTVRKKFISLFDKGKFKQASEAHGGPFRGRVVRSMVQEEWGPTTLIDPLPDEIEPTETPTPDGKVQTEFEWRIPGTFENSILLSYQNAIRNAQRYIYIETQYLIGSGAKWLQKQPSVRNNLPELIAEKIKAKVRAGEDFHAYLVIPMFPEGDPVSGAAPTQRRFEFNTMRFMAFAVQEEAAKAGKDWRDFLSFYFLGRWNARGKAAPTLSGERAQRVAANQRYQLYVHSKLMLIDDEYVILGSANLNERSLAGNRDSEICLSLLADDGKVADVRQVLGDFRVALWKQHLDNIPIPSIDKPERPACSKAIRDAGVVNWQRMAQGVRPDRSHLIHIPFFADAAKTIFFVEPRSLTAELRDQDPFIFDGATGKPSAPGNGAPVKKEWAWDVAKSFTIVPDSLAE